MLLARLPTTRNQPTNNRSVRDRFNIPEKQISRASKLLKEAIDADLIIVRDPEARTRSRSYVLWWARRVEQTELFSVAFHPTLYEAENLASSGSIRRYHCFPLLAIQHVARLKIRQISAPISHLALNPNHTTFIPLSRSAGKQS